MVAKLNGVLSILCVILLGGILAVTYWPEELREVGYAVLPSSVIFWVFDIETEASRAAGYEPEPHCYEFQGRDMVEVTCKSK